MRKFQFKGEEFEWLTFKNEKSPSVKYGKHSFFISDPEFVKERSTFILPKGCGIKVFKNADWQGTDMEDVAIIQNIYWIHGLAPRVREIVKFETRTKYDHFAQVVEVATGAHTLKNIPELERIAEENFITVQYGDAHNEPENRKNWIHGKYLDFGGFKIDREAYKEDLIKRINKVTHYGHLVGGEHISYQSIDELKLDGKRKMGYRIDRLRLNEIDFKDKSVMDLGCNLGMILHYAYSKGAAKLSGYDLTPIILVAREYANLRARFRFDYYAQNLKENPPREKADIVFYLAMSQYLGFPEWLKDITNEICFYEGHANTSPVEAEAQLKKLFPQVINLGFTDDRDVRPIFKCLK